MLYEDIYDIIFTHVSCVNTIKNSRLVNKCIFQSTKKITKLCGSVNLKFLFDKKGLLLLPNLHEIEGEIIIPITRMHKNTILTQVLQLVKNGMKYMNLHHEFDYIKNPTEYYKTFHLNDIPNYGKIICELDYLYVGYRDWLPLGVYWTTFENDSKDKKYGIFEMKKLNNTIHVEVFQYPSRNNTCHLLNVVIIIIIMISLNILFMYTMIHAIT